MLTYLRYALATICFALSVACLGLWGWSRLNYSQVLRVHHHSADNTSRFHVFGGVGYLVPGSNSGRSYRRGWEFTARPVQESQVRGFASAVSLCGIFGHAFSAYHFSLWYPALVFALAGVGALRLGRRFTLRSAIIATTAVAGLLGMVVAL